MTKNEHAAAQEVVAGIIWQEGRILAARRPEGKMLGGFWEFPGGKIEKGESREEALVRELREELGIVAQTVSYWKSLKHVYPQGPVHLHFLHVTEFGNEPEAREGQVLRWTYPKEALDMNFLPPDRPILLELLDKNTRL